MENKKKFSIKDNLDIIVGFGVVGIVLMMIIPLNTKLMDFFVAVNIAVSVIILLTTLFTTSVLEFSIFPSMLLITTLFRLALNLSSTRLILAEGKAGDIINTFGNFVVSGNFVVGVIIFLIIVIVQFVVITSGAGRVSEVAARFTLDAMPGKQMSIDADLNSGLIDENTAKKRRSDLQREADFFGAMDGASKFVKGDAIVGIIITIVNILGGIIIGTLMKDQPIMDSVNQYVKLTIGDGLVSQIPALLISTASGIITTRSGNGENFGKTFGKQMTSFPKVIGLLSPIMLLLAIIPGMPSFIFIVIATVAGVSSYFLIKDEKNQKLEEMHVQEQESLEIEKKEPENVMNLIQVEPMEIEIGYALIPLADEVAGGDLLQRIASVRRQCAIEMGIIVQPIRIRDNLQLTNNEYDIKIRGTVVVKGELMPNMLLCMNPSNEDVNIPGINTVEPTFGLPALWINKDKREEAEIKGLTVVDPTTVLVTHLSEVIKSHAYELLGRQETKMILDNVKEKYSAVVEELVPDLMTIGEIQKVMQNLLKERVSIKDTVTIFEALADTSRNTKDIEILTEYVRSALSRSICNPLISQDRTITVISLSPELENMIQKNLQKSMHGSFPAIDPDTTRSIFQSINSTVEKVYFNDNQPIILVSPSIRPAFRRFIEMVFPQIIVLSLNEIPNDVQIRTEGVVEL
ncbi:flagellar biosynthesis protein FlhA [Hathewaya proteolytica DSM 3090]|uniref:Flagellar biosynthesis protein FlhA n=1 Tax=Hathewaya proteolytica DSM 3090 TaxID=1121331 RepID=A0A1M6L9K1_9CLOT|nr:flagellar biosynthesis protein FlhA [Hathewaya proteolytica]SHJ67789.1 flagellar biosynthesis protein FlhA [Hathewaya proteolytica DSM 3090]